MGIDSPTVEIKRDELPADGEQLLINFPQGTLKEYRASGATGYVVKKCGLHLSIDPVFEAPKD